MKTFEESISLLRGTKEQVSDLAGRQKSLHDDAYQSRMACSLIGELLFGVVNGKFQADEALWFAFLSGLSVGVEMEKAE